MFRTWCLGYSGSSKLCRLLLHGEVLDEADGAQGHEGEASQ